MTASQTLRDAPGITTVAALAVLTGLEYVVSAAAIWGSFAILTIIAIWKAVLILISFMHLKNIRRSEY